MRKYVNITLSIVALITVLVLVVNHFEYDGWQTIFFALIAISAGYWFGRWTCHLHKQQSGFWITIGLFITLNLLHSMIDGASVGDISSFTSGLAVLSHELARQPALYIVLWGMLTPFLFGRQYRLLIAPIAVTGVWILGAYLGYELLMNAHQATWLEPLADQALFLFLGDILHHIYEAYEKLKHPNHSHT
jgi:hypothetical protein